MTIGNCGDEGGVAPGHRPSCGLRDTGIPFGTIVLPTVAGVGIAPPGKMKLPTAVSTVAVAGHPRSASEVSSASFAAWRCRAG